MTKKEFPFAWYGTRVSGGPIIGQRDKERERYGVKDTLKELAEKLLKESKEK